MFGAIKISMSIPGPNTKGAYFSFKLKNNLCNESAEFERPSKLFVLSDIEGNFFALERLLIKNKVINKNLEWTFGDNQLVIVGDCFDRGEQVFECLWLIYSLEERAKRAGGYVHFILGNHEIMNLNGDWRYVHPKYAVKSATSKNPSTALYDGNSELWRWICTKNIIERIGDVLFVHGGISNELLKLNISINEINNLARPYYTKANQEFSDPALHVIFNSNQSPFWYRGFYHQDVTDEDVNFILKYFGVSAIVTGHTIVDKITNFFNGKIINVNTDHTSGNSEALLINKDRFYRIDKEGKRERLK